MSVIERVRLRERGREREEIERETEKEIVWGRRNISGRKQRLLCNLMMQK